MKASSRQWVAALAAVAAILAPGLAFADPPTRVARLNYVKGSVSFRPASLEEWAPATPNYPLTTGDHLWTDTESWAELHIGSTSIRLAPTTAFAFLNLDDRFSQMRLSEGALDVRVRNVDGNGFEIDTPSAAISLTRPGIYRVDVLPDGGSTRVTVRYGAAGVTADGPDFWVREGETAAIYGTDDSVSHEIFRAVPPDNWERWCRARDEREDGSASLRYVSYEMTGYEDLDDYGSWTSVPDYGWGWQPRVAAGWSPYRYGQWRWVEPWGWSWVDDAPWGFAPFHYGRWACLRNSWYWFPGRYHVHPVYAPALVAFIGGDHWGLSFGFGRSHVGWFPLAPGEFWMPHYRASHGYIRNLNVTNVNITNININNYDVTHGAYVNRAVAGAVTAVPRDTFLGGRAVARNALGVDGRTAMRAQVIGTSAPVAPRVESVIGGARGAVSRPASSTLDRAVVARSRPPAAPVPFAAQERALQANGGRPLDDSTLARLRSEAPQSRGNGTPVRLAGARTPGGADRDRGVSGGSAPGQPGSAGYGAGVATRRSGERVAPESSGQTPDVGRGVPGSVRPQVNDRPGWARPRPEGQPTESGPRYEGGATAGARGRSSVPGGQGQGQGQGQGEARPRYGDRPAPRGDSSQPQGDRPDTARPSGDQNSRPGSGAPATRPGSGAGAGVPGARSRGGEARPAAPESKPPDTARPRGGRGGSVSYDSSGSTWSNDRPAGARTWGSSANDRPSSARSWGNVSEQPSPGTGPQYSDTRPVPQYRGVPESRPSPQYRAVPESRPAPQYRAVPESRPSPQYRAVPESRPAPEYRAAPEPRSAPEYRSTPRSEPARPSSGGAVERRGGGGGQQAAPAPPPSRGGSGGGQAAPHGGARSRGRG